MSSKKITKKTYVLVLTGSVGVGKSSVAYAISKIFSGGNISNVVVDLDHIRDAYPKPKNDPFHMNLGYKNLSALWRNYKAVGVTHLIVPNVVENISDLKKIKSAILNTDIKIVRLKADIKTIHNRLRNRDKGESLKWHLNRAIVLTRQLENAKVENFVVDTKNKPILKIAKEIILKLGWL